MRKVAIFGAGKYGGILLNFINQFLKSELQAICYIDNNIPEGAYKNGLKIIQANSIKNLGNEIDIIVSSPTIVDEVVLQLHNLHIENNVFMIPKYAYEFKYDGYELQGGVACPFFVPLDISKPRLPWLECKIVTHCNLNCRGCSALSSIREKEYKTLDEFEEEMRRLKELFSGIKYLKLFGGEPLLHSQLVDFMRVAREYFPDSELVVHSNGLMVQELESCVFEAMRKYNVEFVFSLYPSTGKIKRELETTLNKENIPFRYNVVVYEFRKLINSKGDYNPKEVYQQCFKCINLAEHGKIGCFMGNTIERLEKYFGKEICINKEEHKNRIVDIFETQMDGWEINQFLDTPFETCAYCAFVNQKQLKDEEYIKWAPLGDNEPKLEDWVIQ